MEFKAKNTQDWKIKGVEKGNPDMKAALHNISIIRNNLPFHRLDLSEYNMERLYNDADVVSSYHFKDQRLPRI
jgi:tRNA1(Val) A37 N6-methylase TrmN6